MYRMIGGDGKEYGPVTADQLRQWVAEGRVSSETRVRLEGSNDWKPLSAFPEFAAQAGVSAPPAVTPPGSPARATMPQGQISTYLVPSILCTLFCCLPFGIVAIIYAAQVGSKQGAGDFAGAMESSRKAKMWCWLSFGFGLGVSLIWVAIYLVAIVGGLAQQ